MKSEEILFLIKMANEYGGIKSKERITLIEIQLMTESKIDLFLPSIMGRFNECCSQV